MWNQFQQSLRCISAFADKRHADWLSAQVLNQSYARMTVLLSLNRNINLSLLNYLFDCINDVQK